MRLLDIVIYILYKRLYLQFAKFYLLMIFYKRRCSNLTLTPTWNVEIGWIFANVKGKRDAFLLKF